MKSGRVDFEAMSLGHHATIPATRFMRILSFGDLNAIHAHP